MPGPDFPTGGVLIEDPAAIATAYETGRGGFRLRARWEVERGKNGTWSIVVTEIPYQVQKTRLIEQMAQLLEDKKLPLLGDVRDESTEMVRLVLEPKIARRRARGADGDAVPRHRAGDALPAEHERADRRPHAAWCWACAACCAPGSTIATRCWCAARATGWPRSSGGWRSSTASWRCSSTSTR